MNEMPLIPKSYEQRLDEVVRLSWRILVSRFVRERYIIPTEAPFQHYFGHILSIVGDMFCTNAKDQFRVDLEHRVEGIRGKKKFIDIVCGFQNSDTFCAIELKFKTATQSAQDYGRIDAYLDLESIELATEMKGYPRGYFFMITNSKTYLGKSRVGVGTRFPLSDGFTIVPGVYLTEGIKCKGREGTEVKLRGTYGISWERAGDWYFLCLPYPN